MKTLVLIPVLFLGACADNTAKTRAPLRTSSSENTGADASSKAQIPTSTPSMQPASPSPSPSPSASPNPTPASFTLLSSAFATNQKIPPLHVAKNNGGNQSPPLQWTAAPAGTGSFAIQMVDLDFRTPPFVHWIITNIPATSTQLPVGIPAGNNLAQPMEARGANQPKAYAGPNPPNLHRYEWTIYAIKAGETLSLGTTDSAANKRELEAKSLARSVLVGTYE